MKLINENLFVGFGGSGGKTLARFAELATSDKSLASEITKKVSFLLCDTDLKDLEKAENNIRSSFSNRALEPHIGKIELASGVSSISEHIYAKFNSMTDEGKKRFGDAWWVDSDGIPFMADHIDRNPRTGANQCPAVATFLAWDKVSKIQTEIDKVVRELKHRMPDGGDEKSVGVTFVTSLAGGTGRGCWQLLGFMIREAFDKNNMDAIPTAFFYDKSVFEKVANPEDRLRQSVNSLTGFSEAVMWTRNAHSPQGTTKIDYFLPHLDKPENKEHDIVRYKELPTRKGHTPITSAWSIFGKSISVNDLRDPKQYYNMVAGCLYTEACLTESEKSNRLGKFGSIGSAIWDVPIKGIRALLKTKLMWQICNELLDGTGNEEAADDNVWTNVVNFSQIRDFTGEPVPSRDDAIAKIQRKISKAATGNLKKALKKTVFFKPKTLKESYRQAKILDKISDVNIAEACIAALGSASSETRIQEPQTDLNKALMTLVKSTIDKQLQKLGDSVGASTRVDVTQAILAQLKASKECLEEAKAGAENPKGPILKTVQDAEGVEILTLKFGSRFSDDEINKDILNKVESNRREIAFSKVAEMLSAACSDAIAKLGNVSNSDDAIEVIKGLRKDYAATIASREKSYFTTRNSKGDWILDGKLFTGDRFVARELKPAFENWSSVLDDMKGNAYNKCKESVDSLVKEYMSRQDASRDSAHIFNHKLKNQLKELENSLVLDEEKLKDHFNFTAVLTTILKAWQERLKDYAQDDDRDKLELLFEENFGMKLQPDGGYLHLPVDPQEPEELLIKMSHLLSGSCDAFFVLDNQKHRERGDHVYLFCPTDGSFTLEKENREIVLKDEIMVGLKDDEALAKARLNAEFSPSAGITPYMLVATSHVSVTRSQNDEHYEEDFASIQKDEPINNIVSLRYWSKPVIARWLDDAEKEDGSSFFIGDRGEIYGLGYVDPRVVRDRTYKDMRWNPWLNEDVSEAEKRQNESLDAQLYALLGNFSSDVEIELKDSIIAELGHSSKTKEIWTMPLIGKSNESNSNDFVFNRKVIAKSPMTGKYASNTQSLGGDNKKLGSVAKLESEFDENNDLRESVNGEFQLFTSEILGQVVRTETYSNLVLGLYDYLDELKDNPGGVAELKKKFVKHVGDLMERLASANHWKT